VSYLGTTDRPPYEGFHTQRAELDDTQKRELAATPVPRRVELADSSTDFSSTQRSEMAATPVPRRGELEGSQSSGEPIIGPAYGTVISAVGTETPEELARLAAEEQLLDREIAEAERLLALRNRKAELQARIAQGRLNE